MIGNRLNNITIKRILIDKLKKENAFWSFANENITAENIPDDELIAKTLRHLDLSEINLLFKAYSFKRIKNVWKRMLVPEGEYLYTLNRFFAWYYFKAKHPDAYLQSLTTRYFNRLPQ